MRKLINFCLILLSFSCSNTKAKNQKIPSWYLMPTQNNSANLYGVAQASSASEATSLALVDMASRLIVVISATNTLVREENNISANEEMRQNIKQNIEKIEFSNFEISNSEKIDNLYYREVSVHRRDFIKSQKEKLILTEKKLDNLSANSQNKNPIQKRSDLIKSLVLAKDLELYARILDGVGENINLREKLNRVAEIENEMNKNLDKIEFFFDFYSKNDVRNIIQNALNKEKIAVSKTRNIANKNQILIEISSKEITSEIYGSFICKLNLNFSNSLEGKILASSNVEISGSSVISKEQSCQSALKNLEEKITKDGILKTVGILD